MVASRPKKVQLGMEEFLSLFSQDVKLNENAEICKLHVKAKKTETWKKEFF
jgi:hypothetical protein